jgi:hypothetical protein
MEREFISYEQALALKDLGFDERCIGRYCIVTEWEEPTGEILLQFIDCELSEKTLVKAPLKQQVFRWFREKYELIAGIRYNKFPDMNGKQYYYECDYKNSYERYNTYEEAENAAIDKLIELAKQQDSDETK